jgi:CBS domain-containing protein
MSANFDHAKAGEARPFGDLRPWRLRRCVPHSFCMSGLATGGSLPISELIEESVVRVSPDASLEGVADLLAAGEIGALVVGDDHVVGIITERDVVHAIAQRRDLGGTTAIDIAHTTLIWCDVTSTVAEVAEEMLEHYVRHILVEEEGRFVGIVSARDLLGAYAAAEEPEMSE